MRSTHAVDAVPRAGDGDHRLAGGALHPARAENQHVGGEEGRGRVHQGAQAGPWQGGHPAAARGSGGCGAGRHGPQGDPPPPDRPGWCGRCGRTARCAPPCSGAPARIGDSYYPAADGQVAAKPYRLLRQALQRSARVAITKFAWHNRERRGLLQVLDGEVIALHAMRWPDETRNPAKLAPADTVDFGDSEVDGAIALIDAMTTDDISNLRDHYRERPSRKSSTPRPRDTASRCQRPRRRRPGRSST
ncbi:Ku protein [Streptomyces sp. NPDC057116]|uniref:Ku protein n=1 Tax=Streptomyces sp. NPDC057116 TaxID=3346023 RepID=UPI0036381824